jgi:hypothetical protein
MAKIITVYCEGKRGSHDGESQILLFEKLFYTFIWIIKITFRKHIVILQYTLIVAGNQPCICYIRSHICCDRSRICCDRRLICCDRRLICCDRRLICCDRRLICCNRRLICCNRSHICCNRSRLERTR